MEKLKAGVDAHQILTEEEHADLCFHIGAVKSFLEILDGCLTSPIGEDYLSKDLNCLVTVVCDHATKALSALEKADQGVTA